MHAGDCGKLRQADRLCELGMEVLANTAQPLWLAAIAHQCVPRYRDNEFVHVRLDREKRNTIRVARFEIEPPSEHGEAWRFQVTRCVEDAGLASDFVQRVREKLDDQRARGCARRVSVGVRLAAGADP